MAQMLFGGLSIYASYIVAIAARGRKSERMADITCLKNVLRFEGLPSYTPSLACKGFCPVSTSPKPTCTF